MATSHATNEVRQSFIMMTDRDGVTEKDIQLFDQLPFKNKVIFTHKPYPAFKSAYYIKGFEKQNQVGDIFEFSGWNGKNITINSIT